MDPVGEFFRQVRETKGLTIDDVASKTRIHPDFLKALEEGNFSKLPDQVFAKGFVRSYARSLGLDEDDAMRRFDQSAGTFYDKQSETDRLRLKQIEDEKRKKANRKVVVAAAGVALLGLVLLLTREQSSSPGHRRAEPEPVRIVPSAPSQPRDAPVEAEPPPKPAETQAAPAPTVAPMPVPETPASPAEREASVRGERPGDISAHRSGERTEPNDSAPVSLAEISSEPVPAAGPASMVKGSLVLDMEALDLTWVVVQVDGASPHEALLRAGERVRWKAQDRFTITLGNAGGVRVELDGKQQGPFGPAGKVARDIVLRR
jgi:cytoskeleton protein RodZ